MAQQTAVEWLVELVSLLEQAKQMEKENIKKKKNKDWSEQCKCKDSIGQTWCCNMCGLPYAKLQAIDEISDEDIEKAIIEQDIVKKKGYCSCFLEGAKWYREQLKKK